VIRYGSSWREIPLSEALARAQALAPEVGISRVTDITRLDRLGIPVFTSVRPGAGIGSLCVNAGKGLTADEARVGAYMEAIEFAFGEPRASQLEPFDVPVREVLGPESDLSIVDLCPLALVSIPLDERIQCVRARDLEGNAFLVPSELAYFPFPLPSAYTLFRASTNGLASGATLTEATVHGLFEVIERDIASFDWVTPQSQLVDEKTLPGVHRALIERAREQGLDLSVRWLPSEFDIPCFQAILLERGRLDPMFMTDGFGCHLDPAVALTRAITEAVQGRLSFIHGGRDDIQDRHDEFVGWRVAKKRAYAASLTRRARRRTKPFDFRSMPDRAVGARNLEELLVRTCSQLERAGLHRVLRVELTPRGSALAVVRIIVPGLEYFTPRSPRVGPRLARWLNDA
jgi:ribosomal protein S12 methylthiotransferase accessory factor